MARVGIASRRESERMIEAGRVKVNGTLLMTPAFLVTPQDKIFVDNVPIAKKEPPRLWRYHKPDGLLTTHNDPGGRATVFENLPKDLPRVISVGRLDLTSEGLLLLTNDGELARVLELPSTAWARRYRARVYGRPTQDRLDGLMKGVLIDGVRTGPIEAKLEKQQGGNAWISITIREGKNREIRRAFETLDMRVNRLIRISYGPFQLGDLLKAGVEEIPNRILKDQVGHLLDIPETRPQGTIKVLGKGGKVFGKGGKKISPKARFKPGRASPSKANTKTKGFRPSHSKPAPKPRNHRKK
ncbi:MAG: rRNA pseudouridine synthase [Robiginitomaculum sp.]|nr:rRNA pseudouridine synthase [Robiginitomaculum sp.]